MTVERSPLMNSNRWSWLNQIDLVCDVCSAEEDEANEERLRAEAHALRTDRWRSKSGVPHLLRGLTWGDVDSDGDRADAIEAAKRWGQGELQGLVLTGPVGVGKSWIAAAAANARLERERLRWYSVPALIAHAVSDFKSADRKDAVDTLTGYQAVVLDDIDKVKATDWVASQLFVAIDGRVQNGGGFLVTTNLEMQVFADTFGEAIADRLFGGASEVHVVNGRSRR